MAISDIENEFLRVIVEMMGHNLIKPWFDPGQGRYIVTVSISVPGGGSDGPIKMGGTTIGDQAAASALYTACRELRRFTE